MLCKPSQDVLSQQRELGMHQQFATPGTRSLHSCGDTCGTLQAIQEQSWSCRRHLLLHALPDLASAPTAAQWLGQAR